MASVGECVTCGSLDASGVLKSKVEKWKRESMLFALSLIFIH